MTKLIYDEFCAWPYVKAYGMVAAPKVKKPRKPRKSRAMPAWLKEQRKRQRRAQAATRSALKVRITPLVANPPEGFAETFAAAARNPKE